MSLYTLALFVHVSGAIGIFGGMGAYVFGVAALWRAQSVAEVRHLAHLIVVSGNVVAGSIVALGLAGFYMAATVWGIEATWLIVATISFILLAPGGLLLIEPRIRAIIRQARRVPDGPLPEELAGRVRDPLLRSALSIYIACLFGIVFLMTNKPATGNAIGAMVIAVAAGLLASFPFWRPPAPKRSAEEPISSESQ
ncbi:MAG TPA: DUF2269 family protein [Ktedonobacterales bacterium]